MRPLVSALLVVAFGAPPMLATPPTPVVPAAPDADAPSVSFSCGVGPEPAGTGGLEGYLPTLAFSAGGSIPIRGRAFVDLAMDLTLASYSSFPPVTGWGGDVTTETIAFTVAGRAGHTGKTVGVFGSAGFGLAHVRLSTPTWFGIGSSEWDSVWTPVLQVAGSLELPSRKRNRFLVVARYAWIEADFPVLRGSLDVGGLTVLFGARHLF